MSAGHLRPSDETAAISGFEARRKTPVLQGQNPPRTSPHGPDWGFSRFGFQGHEMRTGIKCAEGVGRKEAPWRQRLGCHLPSAAWVQAGSTASGPLDSAAKAQPHEDAVRRKAAFKSMHTFVCRFKHPHSMLCSYSYQIHRPDARESREGRRKICLSCAQKAVPGQATASDADAPGTAAKNRSKRKGRPRGAALVAFTKRAAQNEYFRLALAQSSSAPSLNHSIPVSIARW